MEQEEILRFPAGRHPRSLAALFRHQVRAPFQRQCAKCKRIALKGSKFCQGHAFRLTRPSPAFGRAERRTLVHLDLLGLLPAELTASRVYRDLAVLPTRLRAPLRLRLVLLWHERERQPLKFAQAWRDAIAAPMANPIVCVNPMRGNA